MAQPIDLGHSLFQTTGSPLQLQFSATAYFTQDATGSNPSPTISFSHWKDLQLLWITEAPQLELRIFVNADLEVEIARPTFVASVEEGLCNSKLWTDLGFDIILKSRPKFGDPFASGTHCLAFGLCRRSISHASTNSKSLPPFLRNPPEVHTPSDVPTVRLASIDLRLRYASCGAVQHLEMQIVETLEYKPGYETERQHGPCSMEYTHSTGKIAVAAFALSTMEDLLLPFDQPFNANGSNYVDPIRQKKAQTNEPSLQFLDLFDFGLQRLFLSRTTKNHHIKVVGKNKLQNLSLLAPAIFNPEYREAMKQRAISLSTISRSLMPMLENSNNTVLQSKLSAILRKSRGGEEFVPSGMPHETPLTNNFKSKIESSLWSIAQDQLKKAKTSKTSASFFEPPYDSRELSLQTDEDTLLPVPSEQDFGFDGEILGLDSDPGILPILNHSRMSDKLLSDGSSMFSFQDLHELTQTTEMTQMTQTSTEDLSQTLDCQPCCWDDMDILRSDENLMDEDVEQYGDFDDMELF